MKHVYDPNSSPEDIRFDLGEMYGGIVVESTVRAETDITIERIEQIRQERPAPICMPVLLGASAGRAIGLGGGTRSAALAAYEPDYDSFLARPKQKQLGRAKGWLKTELVTLEEAYEMQPPHEARLRYASAFNWFGQYMLKGFVNVASCFSPGMQASYRHTFASEASNAKED